MKRKRIILAFPFQSCLALPLDYWCDGKCRKFCITISDVILFMGCPLIFLHHVLARISIRLVIPILPLPPQIWSALTRLTKIWMINECFYIIFWSVVFSILDYLGLYYLWSNNSHWHTRQITLSYPTLFYLNSEFG